MNGNTTRVFKNRIEAMEKQLAEKENQIAHYKRELELSQKEKTKLLEVIDLLPEVIFEISKEGMLGFINSTGYNIFGYTHDDFLKGFNVLDLFIEADQDRVSPDNS
jgi:PAS domain-containing protein